MMKGVIFMYKLFAIRDELLNNREQREKLKIFLKRGGNIANLTVTTGFQYGKLLNEAPFLPKGFVYDKSKVEHFSQRKLGIAIALLLNQEGERSVFFCSENMLLNHIKSYN